MNVVWVVWVLIGISAVQIALPTVSVIETILLTFFDWYWSDQIEKYVIGVLSVVISVKLNQKYQTMRSTKIERASQACRFAIKEGRAAVKALQEALNRGKGPEFSDAYANARDATKFGRTNYQKVKKLVGRKFPDSDSTLYELKSIDDRRIKLLNNAIEKNALASIWDPSLLSKDQDEVDARVKRYERSEPRISVADRFEAAWEVEHPAGFLERLKRRFGQRTRVISESMLATTFNNVSRVLSSGSTSKNK